MRVGRAVLGIALTILLCLLLLEAFGGLVSRFLFGVPPDVTAPEIVSVDYGFRVAPGSVMGVRIKARDDREIGKVVVEFHGENYTAVLSGGFYRVALHIPVVEGRLNFTIYAIDEAGNAAVLTRGFESYDDPEINFINYNFIPPDRLFLNVSARDTSGIDEVIATVQGRNYTLEESDGFYVKEVRDGLIYGFEELRITVYVFDRFRNFATKVVEATPTLKEKFVSFYVEKGIKPDVAERFYEDYSYLVSELYPANSDLLLPMVGLSENMSLFNLISRIVQDDERITLDRNYALSKISELFLELGFIGKVKVYDPATDSYREGYLSLPTVFNVGNYCLAVYQFNLPMHNKSDLWLAFNASQLEPLLVNAKPVILPSANSSDVTIPVDPQKLAWAVTEHLKRIRDEGINILKYPEMLEGIGIKTWSNLFWTFDYPYGIAYMEKKLRNVDLTLDNDTLWDLYLLQFNYYWNATPQAGNVSGIPLFYRWYNSSLLREDYPNETDRRMAGLWGFRLPAKTVDLKKGRGKEGEVFGINAAHTFLRQIQEKKEEILPKLNDPYWKDRTLDYFAAWLADRANHGLENTISQFIGYNFSRAKEKREDLSEIIMNMSNPGIIQTLRRYDPQLADKIIFLLGYARQDSWGGDTWVTYYGAPTMLGIFLIPHSRMGVGPRPPGTLDDWTISIPYSTLKKVYEKFSNSLILIGPGNMLGIYSGGNGLIKDGINMAAQAIGDYLIYLMKLD